MPEVAKERTGWRDESLSQRHRRWGMDAPAVDLDFLLLEYDRGKAVALVEYKHERAAPQYRTHPTYRAIMDLGTRAGIPVFAVRYAGDFSWWNVTPLNDNARKWVPSRLDSITEAEWVKLLYSIRGYSIPDSILEEMHEEI